MFLFRGLVCLIILFVVDSCIPREHNVQNPYPSADPKAPNQFYVKWHFNVTSSDAVTVKVSFSKPKP